MTDEAIVIHSILFLNSDLNRKSWSNRNRLNNSRDDNNLSRIKLNTIWWERFEKFSDFLDRSFTIDFCLYLSTNMINQNEIIFYLNNWFETTRIVDERWTKVLVQVKYQIIHQHSVKIFQQSIVANKFIIKRDELLFEILLEI